MIQQNLSFSYIQHILAELLFHVCMLAWDTHQGIQAYIITCNWKLQQRYLSLYAPHSKESVYLCYNQPWIKRHSHLKRDRWVALDAWAQALHPCLRSQLGWQPPFLHRLFIFACFKGTWAPLNMVSQKKNFLGKEKEKGIYNLSYT